MHFSLRPGIAFMALMFAISVVNTIVLLVLGMFMGVTSGPGLDSKKGSGHPGMFVLVAMFVSIASTFVIADLAWPHLCAWTARHRAQ